jgi:chloramphenicol-sensitive protein RarD
MGLLQYITPILQLLWAVLVRHEMLTVATWVGFGMVWCALLLFSADAIRHKRKAPLEKGRFQRDPRIVERQRGLRISTAVRS